MSSAPQKSVYLVACGGHGRVVLDAFISSKKTVDGIIDAQLVPGSEIFGVKVLGDDSYLKTLIPSTQLLLMAWVQLVALEAESKYLNGFQNLVLSLMA